MNYIIDINDLTVEDIENNLIIDKFDGIKDYASVKYKYPNGIIRPFIIRINNLTLPNNCVPKYNDFYMIDEYNAERYVFKMKVQLEEHIFKIFQKIDEKLENFDNNINNNIKYNNNTKFSGICKYPTIEKAKYYKYQHNINQTSEEIKNNLLNTYIKFKYQLPIDEYNHKIHKFNEYTEIPKDNLIIKKNNNININIDQPYTLDFLNLITQYNNNISIIIEIKSWYSMKNYYGYKAFIRSIKLNYYYDKNKDFEWNDEQIIVKNEDEKQKDKKNKEINKKNNIIIIIMIILIIINQLILLKILH